MNQPLRDIDQCMSNAQKGTGRDPRGAKHHLTVDRTVAQDCRL